MRTTSSKFVVCCGVSNKQEDDRLMEAMEAMEASGDVNNRYRLRDWEIIARGCRGRTAGQCEMR